jgi:hypothetical protein
MVILPSEIIDKILIETGYLNLAIKLKNNYVASSNNGHFEVVKFLHITSS